MAVIESTNLSKAKRIESVRHQAGNVSNFTMSDDSITNIMEKWDDWVKKSINVETITGNEPFFKILVNASNLRTSAEIRHSINSSDTKIDSQIEQATNLILTINDKAPEQGKPIFSKTNGINNQLGTFG